jgi:flagellar hook protein FlgE
MSINSAMLAGVSGLVANSSALAAISDNIANVNTVAYKRNQVNFSQVVTAQAVPGHYSAGGVEAITRQLVHQQGLIQTANSPTDLAINGDGFFVATTKGFGLTNADPRVFTRSGSFTVDANGYMVNDAGLYLQGWPADPNGAFNVNPSDLTMMQPINVKALGTAVAPTTTVQINATLNSNQAINPATYAPGDMAQYASDVETNAATPGGVKPDFTMEMTVFDSVGGAHKIALAVHKDNTAGAVNTWDAEIYAVPATDVTSATTNGLLSTGKLAFDNNGAIDWTNTTVLPAPPASLISLGASGSGTTPRWADNLGINNQTITLDMSKVNQLPTTANVLNSVNSDGASVGNLVGVKVDEQGIVSAIFDNNQIRPIAKIGLATFPNPDGLKATSGGAYEAAVPAGVMVIKEAGLGGSGKISPSSLEASTVDLSSEFTGLITTQRAYSASSKIITTADQMLDELIQMKR